jgi:hypothetical protein
MGFMSGSLDDDSGGTEDDEAQESGDLEDGTLDPDELSGEPNWWDEGSDDED